MRTGCLIHRPMQSESHMLLRTYNRRSNQTRAQTEWYYFLSSGVDGIFQLDEVCVLAMALFAMIMIWLIQLQRNINNCE